jgi:hypothetical protein
MQTMGFNPSGDLKAMDKEVGRMLYDAFRFEFLNRFDRIVHFHPLTRKDIRTIALRELEKLKERVGMKQRRLQLDVDEDVLDWITVNGYDPYHGARFLRRMIERHVTTAISETIVRDNPGEGAQIELQVRKNRVKARLMLDSRDDLSRQKETLSLPVGTTRKSKSLDLNHLMIEARELVNSSGGRLAGLKNDRKEAAGLLDRINTPGFWDQMDIREEVLDRYRTLDVSIRMQERYASPIIDLSELIRDNQPEASVLSSALESAAASFKQWEDRMADEGHAEVWMMISTSNPMKQEDKWIRNIVNMELAWCGKLGLTASVAAYSLSEGALNRVVLEVEGPGAEVYLSMEKGIHRLHFPQARDIKIRVEVLKSGLTKDHSHIKIRPVRHRKGEFGLVQRYRAALEIKDRGLIVELLTEDENVLARMLPDLNQYWEGNSMELEVVRIYGKDGIISDPRTGVTSGRIKDVWKGRLDEFLEGWRRMGGKLV